MNNSTCTNGLFVQGEMVSFSDRYNSGYGIVRYQSERTGRVVIDSVEDTTIIINAQFVDSIQDEHFSYKQAIPYAFLF